VVKQSGLVGVVHQSQIDRFLTDQGIVANKPGLTSFFTVLIDSSYRRRHKAMISRIATGDGFKDKVKGLVAVNVTVIHTPQTHGLGLTPVAAIKHYEIVANDFTFGRITDREVKCQGITSGQWIIQNNIKYGINRALFIGN